MNPTVLRPASWPPDCFGGAAEHLVEPPRDYGTGQPGLVTKAQPFDRISGEPAGVSSRCAFSYSGLLPRTSRGVRSDRESRFAGETIQKEKLNVRTQNLSVPRITMVHSISRAAGSCGSPGNGGSLVATVVGSGIMAETLTKDVALALTLQYVANRRDPCRPDHGLGADFRRPFQSGRHDGLHRQA